MSNIKKSPVAKSDQAGQRVNLSKITFSGGTSLHWNLFKPRFMAEMKAKQAFEFVDLNLPGARAEDGSPIELSLGFTRPCPVGDEITFIQDQMGSQIEAIQNNLAENIQLLDDLPNNQMTAATRAVEIAKLRMKTNDEIVRVNNSRLTLMKDLETSIVQFEKREDTHRQRLADCIKIFYQMLGPGPLSIAEIHLRESRPRAAFLALNTHYNAGVGGQEASSNIMAQMQNFPMDLSSMSLTEHMNLMEQLAIEFEGGGLNHPLPNTFIMHAFLCALVGATTLFEDEVLFIKHNNLTWEQAKLKLQEKEASLLVQKSVSKTVRKAGGGKTEGSSKDIHSLIAKAVSKAIKRGRDETASAATAGSPQKKPRPVCTSCNKPGHLAADCWKDKICPKCGVKGHIEKFCPSVTGKPFGSPKKLVKACNSVTELGNGPVATSPHLGFHCDLCGETAACLSDLEDDREVQISYLEVQIVREDLLVALLNSLALNCREEVVASERRCHRSLRIILDSGASSHMVPCKSLLRGVSCSVQGEVSLGKSDYKLRIVGLGTTTVKALESVLWVPGLSFGLISISKLDVKGYSIMTEHGKVAVRNEVGEVVLSGTLESNGLYYLDESFLAELWGSSRCTCLSQQVTAVLEEGEVIEEITSPGVQAAMLHEKAQSTVEESSRTLELLHRRFGHPGERVLKKAFKNGNFSSKLTYDDVKDGFLKFCPSCYEGKMKAFASPDTSRRREFQLFEKFGIDYKGPFRVQSVHGHTGFYLIGDYASSNVFAFPCKSKGQETVFEILEEYKAIVGHAGKVLRFMQCDFDAVLLGGVVEGWLLENELRLQTSAPYTHWQNGFIESMIGKVMDKTRCMMAAYRTPHRFWSYAVLTACYLCNRLPVEHLNKTPFEARFGEKPDPDKLVPFWCPGMYHLTKAEREGSLDYKARPCRMLGYDERMKDGYYVYDIISQKILSRHDCVWNEDVLEIASVDNQNGEPDSSQGSHDTTVEEDVGDDEEILLSPHAETVPEGLDDDQPYWKASKEETANLLERWLEEVRVLAANLFAVQEFLGSARTELEIKKLPPIPKSVEEALAGPDAAEWRKAIDKELKSFEDRGVFAEAPQEGRAMKTKMILRTQYRNDYTIKFKARLVACGYSQIYGVDYKETYAPTASTSAVLLAIQLGAMQGKTFSEFDVTAAFLEGKNDYQNFARLPAFLGGLRVEVVGNFYGEKQGPKIWNDQLHGILERAGFVRCPAHPCLYKKVKEGKDMWIVVHVDDGLIMTDCLETRAEFLKYFGTQVLETTHLDVVGRYVGMDFDFFPEERKVLLSHKLYIAQKWEGFNRLEKIPMNPTSNLRTAKSNPNNPSMLHDTGEFRFMCDRGRPDMLVVTGELATGGAEDPSDEHLKVAEKAKNYLKSTQFIGLSLGGLGKVHIFGYSDASWVTDGNCKSRLGGCVFLNADSGAICSFSRNDTKPSSLSHSSCEAEIKAMDEWLREVIHIMDMYKFLCGPYDEPVHLYVDSLSAIQLCETLRQSHNVKHINMRIHAIREMIEDGFLELHFITTDKNVADVLTKALAEAIFTAHRKVLLEGHGGVLPRDDERVHVSLNAVSIVELYSA